MATTSRYGASAWPNAKRPHAKPSNGKILKEVYAKAKAEDKYKCSYYPGPHKFDSDMQKEAFEWFDKWLKG